MLKDTKQDNTRIKDDLTIIYSLDYHISLFLYHNLIQIIQKQIACLISKRRKIKIGFN